MFCFGTGLEKQTIDSGVKETIHGCGFFSQWRRVGTQESISWVRIMGLFLIQIIPCIRVVVRNFLCLWLRMSYRHFHGLGRHSAQHRLPCQMLSRQKDSLRNDPLPRFGVPPFIDHKRKVGARLSPHDFSPYEVQVLEFYTLWTLTMSRRTGAWTYRCNRSSLVLL